jgi:ribosome-binding factor A
MSMRLTRVNELLKREISSVIQRDYEWHGSLVTVNAVEVTQDLKEAKVWIGVLAGRIEPVVARLNQDHGAIQTKVMKRVVLKSTPVLDFRHDGSAERGVEIVNLLEEVDQLPKAPEPEEDEEADPR